MIDLIKEQSELIKCEDTLKGLAKLTEFFKSGCLENEYWNKTPEEMHNDTIDICQTIITCLNDISFQLSKTRYSIETKELESNKNKIICMIR